MDDNISYFMSRLSDLSALPADQALSREEIRRHFSKIELDDGQMNQIISYLSDAGIKVSEDGHMSVLTDDIKMPEYDLEDLTLPEGIEDADLFEAFLSQIGETKALTSSEDLGFSQAALRGDSQALTQLTQRNMRLVFAIAKTIYKPSAHISFYDLFQEGCMGLLKAAEKYGKREIRFSVYASFWIRQYMVKASSFAGREASFSSDMAQTLNNIKDAAERLEKEYGLDPSPSDIAEFLEIPEKKVTDALEFAGDDLKLSSGAKDRKFDQAEDLLKDRYLSSDQTWMPDQARYKKINTSFMAAAGQTENSHSNMEESEANISGEGLSSEKFRPYISQVLDGLRPLEQDILSFYYGFGKLKAHSSKEVCRRFGISQEHLLGICARAMFEYRRRK